MSRAKRSYEDTLCDDAHMMGSPHRGPAVSPSASPCAQQHAAAASSTAAAAAASSQQHAPSAQQHQPQPQSTAALFRMHRLAAPGAGAAAPSMTGFESRAHAPAPSLFSLDNAAAMQSPTRAAASSSAASSSSSSSSSAAHTPFFSSPSSSSSSAGAAAATSAASSTSSGCLASSKRSRRGGAADVSAMCDESSAQQSPNPTSATSSSLPGSAEESEEGTTNGSIHASPFAKLKRVHIDEVIQVPRSYKKQAIAAALAGPSSLHHGPIAASPHIPAPPSSNPQSAGLASYHHQLFTYDQVASIVRNAVEMRESQIRAEYDATLARLLAEQFESFSNFNKDYISRSMQRSDDHENSIYS